MRRASLSTFALLWLGFVVPAAPVRAEPPRLLATPFYQSPVSASPDSLLQLTGSPLTLGDRVLIGAHGNTSEPTVVRVNHDPDSIIIRLPRNFDPKVVHDLRVVTKNGTTSNSIRIGDPRPLWFSPSFAYETQAIAELPRYLKVVGRNLLPGNGLPLRIRLRGSHTWELRTAPATLAQRELREFAAMAELPRPLAAGDYVVEISADARLWVAVPGQILRVERDPLAAQEFSVARYGCRGDDDLDDTRCIVQAVRDATRVNGRVKFTRGQWQLADATLPGVTPDGIVVPRGVRIDGDDAQTTRLVRHATWQRSSKDGRAIGLPCFTLTGFNEVRGITFQDQQRYQPADHFAPALQLGMRYDRANLATSIANKTTTRILIHHNVFDRTFSGVADGGLPISEMFIVNNIFGAYWIGLAPGGDRSNVERAFDIADSVVAFNTFYPGGYLDVPARQGAIASSMGASRRVDFSDNVADGAARDYLYDPARDASGWRAAFFWHLGGNHEMLLVANNRIDCAGDKTGDGEAISFDNNRNTFGFAGLRAVRAAGESWVEIDGPLDTLQGAVKIPDEYYVGNWLRISSGPGTGQARKIIRYAFDDRSGRLRLDIAPHWDVPPVPAQSAASLSRTFWQVYVVANTIDQRTERSGRPLCTKGNRRNTSTETINGGTISLWAQMTDTVIVANRQFDSGGIWLHVSSRDDAEVTGHSFLSFVEVARNLIQGEYDWYSDCSWSGIYGSFGLSAPLGARIPVAAYGWSIADNQISHADGPNGGAISLALGWRDGPPPHRWQLLSGAIIQHNTLTDLRGAPATGRCIDDRQPRSGIVLWNAALAWRTMLYANRMVDVDRSLLDHGTQTFDLSAAFPSNSKARQAETAH